MTAVRSSARTLLTDAELRARDRMRLVTPETAYKVLGHPRYWTRPFVDLLMQRCDDLGRLRPDLAAPLAEQLPILVSRVRLDDSEGSYANAAQHRSALALGHVLRDHYLQRVGRLDHAAEDDAALERLLRRGLHGHVLAERLKRRAIPVFLEGDGPRALRMLHEAIECAGWDHPAIVREALLLRGMMRQRLLRKSALDDFGIALFLVEAVDQGGGRQLIEIALALDYDLLRFAPDSGTLCAVGHLLKVVRQRWAVSPKCRAKGWLYWLAGSVVLRMGIDRHARRLLTKASGLVDAVGHPFERAMVQLDLAIAASSLEDPEATRRHVLEAVDTLVDLDLAPELACRLAPWFERPDPAALRSIRRICWPWFAEAVRG